MPCKSRPGLHVDMMQGRMLIVPTRRPIGEDVRQFCGIGNAKSQVNVRPPVFTLGRCGTSDRSASDTKVVSVGFQEIRAQLSTFFQRKHHWHVYRVNPS